MKTIVALVDFSDGATNVLKEVQTLAGAFKSQVIVVNGIPEKATVDAGVASAASSQKPAEEELQADMTRLQRMTEPLVACGLSVRLKQFHRTTVERVVEEALNSGADLIVVGSHHHNSFYNLLVGSVTHLVLKSAKCPVLVVAVE